MTSGSNGAPIGGRRPEDAPPGHATDKDQPPNGTGLRPAAQRLAAAADRWRGRITALCGWRRRGAAFGAGALSVLALAPFFLWPVLFFTLPVLVWLIDEPGDAQAVGSPVSRRSLTRAAGAGWWFGFGYFVFGLFWIGEAFLVEAEVFAWLLPFAVTLLPAGLAFFYAAATAAARAVWTSDARRVAALAATLSMAEWARGHVLTGFPWNVLGYALTYPLALMQSAAIFGIYGLTVLTVVVFALPLVVVAGSRAGDRRDDWRLALVSPAALLALLAYGHVVLARDPGGVVEGVRIRIVQPSIAQRDKWRRDKQREIFDLHLALSRTDAGGRVDDLAGVTLLVWPEAAMPFLPLDTPQALDEIGALLPKGTTLLAGALRVERPPGAADGSIPASSEGIKAFNSMIAFGEGGRPIAVYDKTRLVPFGEFLPLQPLLEAIGLRQLTRMRGGFTQGPTPRPLLDLPGLPPIAALVCYEALFPGEVWQGSRRPGLIVNVTNDGWFGNTTGPRQHLHQARVRAVEEGLPLLRAANNGISALVDSRGQIIASLNLSVRGTIDAPLPKPTRRHLPQALGAWVFLVLLACCVLFVAFGRRRENQ